jgi:hypothetical protein
VRAMSSHRESYASQPGTSRDLYDVLGVDRDATQDEIRKSYRYTIHTQFFTQTHQSTVANIHTWRRHAGDTVPCLMHIIWADSRILFIRKLAMRHHPDRRQSSPEACEEAFKEVTNAYKVPSAQHRACFHHACKLCLNTRGCG